MKLAFRIRKIREFRDFSQEYVAEMLGVSQAAYLKMERNADKSKFSNLIKIASALNVSIAFMIDVKSDNFQSPMLDQEI